MKILLVEDDKNLCDILKFQLNQEMHDVDVCHNEQKAAGLIFAGRIRSGSARPYAPDDERAARPEKSAGAGYSHARLILITALGELYDRIEGLDTGADDYLVKPFAFEELSARIRSLGRRTGKYEENDLLCFGDLSYDAALRSLRGPAGSIRLSGKESTTAGSCCATPEPCCAAW